MPKCTCITSIVEEVHLLPLDYGARRIHHQPSPPPSTPTPGAMLHAKLRFGACAGRMFVWPSERSNIYLSLVFCHCVSFFCSWKRASKYAHNTRVMQEVHELKQKSAAKKHESFERVSSIHGYLSEKVRVGVCVRVCVRICVCACVCGADMNCISFVNYFLNTCTAFRKSKFVLL